MDGFILTHAVERVDVPEQEQVDAFLPPVVPRQVLDPAAPVSIGAMVGPEAFMEVRYLAHANHMRALEVIPQVARDFAEIFGRDSGGLVRPYRCDDAETIIVALGSVLGTIKDVVDEQRDKVVAIGVLGITSFRPFPLDEVREALKNVKRVVVLEKALAVGIGGILAANVRTSRAGIELKCYTVIAGLGGRAITKESLHGLFDKASADDLERLTFLDLDHELVDRELEREKQNHRSGSPAENVLRDSGIVGARL
jgi:pyruvate ferredoxin oxidoreductase alpha subunit